MNTLPILYKSNDNHCLTLFSAKEFVNIPSWEGNRLINQNHVEEIKKSIPNNSIHLLEKTLFRVIGVVDEDDNELHWYIFDGQHRSSVIKEYFTNNPFNDDFKILVMWKIYQQNETKDIHKDFLDANRTFPIQWTADPVMMANSYITALLQKFEQPVKKGKKRGSHEFIREGKTKKPFLSVDKLRDMIIRKYDKSGWNKTAEEFAESAFAFNERMLEGISTKDTKTPLEERILELGFALSIDEYFLWI